MLGVPPARKWYTWQMPTARQRYQVTETDSLSRALDAAARKWPGEPRSKLLLRLVEAGASSVEEDQESVEGVRRAAVLASSGAYDDAYPEGYLTELREDWPA